LFVCLLKSQVQSTDTTKLHDWTIPDSQFITRPSLLKVIGVNDPSDTGEVRISFGAFLAAGSGELGSLSRSSPDRPRVGQLIGGSLFLNPCDAGTFFSKG